MPDQIYGVTWNGAEKVSYTYDPLGRLTNRKVASFSNAYTYENVGEDKTTTLVQSVVTPAGTYSYTYDNIGNILGIADGTYTSSYEYDSLNQLVSVNGDELTYDENGNLLTYGDKTFSWCHGTRLESITDGENEYSYVYDENGTRFSKTVNGTTTQFAYLGGRLMAQKTGEDVLFFQYGAGGVPLGFVLNGVQYFYITNQLGDVIGITDSTGKAIVEYTYDEWGNPIQTRSRDNTAEQNKIAEINPPALPRLLLRYGNRLLLSAKPLLQPRMGSFPQPDAFGYIDNSTRLGFNAYIYCTNNPVMFVDPTGTKKTNNWFEAALQVMCLGIEIDTFTRIFENAVQIFNVAFDLNEWFNTLTSAAQDFFSGLMLYIATGLNDLFSNFWNDIIVGSIEFSFKKLIDEPLELLSKLPKLSWDVPAIKFAPVVGSFFSFFDIVNSINKYGWNSKEGIILVVENLLSIIADFIPVVGNILSAIGDLSTVLTNIYFKFENGEYI